MRWAAILAIGWVAAIGCVAHAGAASQSTATQANAAQPAAIGPVTPPLVAVVDVQELLKRSTASQRIRQQLETLRDRYQQEAVRQEEQLLAAEKELGRQRASLPQDDFDAKRRQFETQVAEMQRTVQERRRSLDALAAEADRKLGETMQGIVGEVAREHGIDLVLARQLILYQADRSFDITNIVLERLNQRLPEIAISGTR